MMVNFILSHPQVCISSGETHKVFKPGTRFDKGWLRIKKRLFYDYPIRFFTGQNFFKPNLMKKRNRVPDFIKTYIDRILYEGRFIARIESHNLYQSEGVKYTDEELAKCRLLTKGLNGMVFTVETFKEMYPDAVFLGLVRNGLAVCEGRIRRGAPLETFSHHYKSVVEEMLRLEKELPNYHLFKFEDMINDPLAFMRSVYEKSDLDISKVQKIRLESKAVMDSKGQHSLSKGYDRQVFWYEPDQVREHIKPNINENQIKVLRPAHRDTFLKIAGEAMEKLNYSV